MDIKKFKHAAVGGTFDHFHKGHESLLLHGFKSAEKVTIGIMDTYLLQKKEFQSAIQSFEERKKQVEVFLTKNNLRNRATILALNDIYGPAINNLRIDAIIVSKETRSNAVQINKIRTKKGLAKLKIITISFIKASDKKIIRSSRIRKGEISADGQNYLNLFKTRTLLLPKHMKRLLRQPFGRIIKGSDNNIDITAQKAISLIQKKSYPLLITVGDVVSASFTANNFKPSIQVIDKKTQRQEYIHTQNLDISSFSKNNAGTIQKRAVSELNRKIKKFIITNKPSTLLIQGEEDLLALPAMLLAPLNSLVIYGQAGIGMVLVEITTELKTKVEKLLSEFK